MGTAPQSGKEGTEKHQKRGKTPNSKQDWAGWLSPSGQLGGFQRLRDNPDTTKKKQAEGGSGASYRGEKNLSASHKPHRWKRWGHPTKPSHRTRKPCTCHTG